MKTTALGRIQNKWESKMNIQAANYFPHSKIVSYMHMIYSCGCFLHVVSVSFFSINRTYLHIQNTRAQSEIIYLSSKSSPAQELLLQINNYIFTCTKTLMYQKNQLNQKSILSMWQTMSAMLSGRAAMQYLSK